MLPNWITQADVDAAAAKMLTDPNSVAPEDILDQSPAWQGCFVRITPDSARLPITFAQAMMGVDFETMGIPAGAYSIWGYTWEPLFNLWKLRPGVVKVVDVPDPAQSGPALALQLPMGDPIFYKDQKGTFTACVDAMDGSEVTLLWSLASDGSGWTPIGAAEPVVQGDNTFDIDMPMPTWGTDFLLRADIEDPMGRTYTAYYSEIITVLAADDPSGCSDMGGGGFIGDPGCTAGSSGSGPSSGTSGSGGSASASGSGSGGSAGTASGGTTDTSGTSGTKENGGGGCACTSGAAPRHGAVALPLVWAFLARRRRRSGQRALEREGGIAA
jgi:MYXO-CTERM domain-containing protein